MSQSKKKNNASLWDPPAEHRGIGLRTVNKDYRAYGGFQWPEGTGYCEAPDWNPEGVCGGGLHLLPNGRGDIDLMDWSDTAIGQICEYDSREAVKVGHDKVKVPRCNVIKVGVLRRPFAELMCDTAYITKQVEDVWEACKPPSTTGDDAHASTTGGRAIAACLGIEGRAKAGPDGVIVIAWSDGVRPRVAVGYVGEDGIKEGTWYRVVNGKLTEDENDA